MNWIKCLHKVGVVNNVTIYQTIMVGLLMANLLWCIMEYKWLLCRLQKNFFYGISYAYLEMHGRTLSTTWIYGSVLTPPCYLEGGELMAILKWSHMFSTWKWRELIISSGQGMPPKSSKPSSFHPARSIPKTLIILKPSPTHHHHYLQRHHQARPT